MNLRSTCGIPIPLRAFRRACLSTESKADFRFTCSYMEWTIKLPVYGSSDNSRRASIASVVDLPAVNPDCCGLRRFFNSGLILATRTWMKSFPGTDNRDMGL